MKLNIVIQLVFNTDQMVKCVILRAMCNRYTKRRPKTHNNSASVYLLTIGTRTTYKSNDIFDAR